MYNLLVTAEEGAWNETTYVYPRSRVFEYTTSAISDHLSKLDSEAIETLVALPTLLAYEHPLDEPAHFGRLTEIRTRPQEVRVGYTIDRNVAPIPPSKLEQLSWELDLGNFEMNRTHWAVKDEDLLSVLADAGLLDRQQITSPARTGAHALESLDSPSLVVSPSVFRRPRSEPESDLVSVMMPFDSSFSKVYDAIRAACLDAAMRCQRTDGLWEESDVMQDIFNLIFRSRIVVVDFSGKYPNVMYETGIAHTLGRPVIPLAQSIDDVPFDLRHHRVLTYLPNNEGLAEMRRALKKRISTLAG